MKREKCVICGTTKIKFITAQKGGLLLNKVIKKLTIEIHLPGNNFTRPCTELKKILNPDLTPKNWT